jgi:succinyl-CoA synthetase alpha subunit
MERAPLQPLPHDGALLADARGARIIGPNCLGVIAPGVAKKHIAWTTQQFLRSMQR